MVNKSTAVATHARTPGRGRPPAADLRDSRSALFEAAAREFAERGFDAAGVDRIAARARVNKAMLYYHFTSKLGLYHEVLNDMFRAVGQRVRRIADEPGDADAKLDRWIRTIVEEAGERAWFPPIMLRELASGGTHLDRDTLGLMNVVVSAMRDIVLQGQREGRFGQVDPLLVHLTITPTILIFFARQGVVARRMKEGAASDGVAAPIAQDAFIAHITSVARRMLHTGGGS